MASNKPKSLRKTSSLARHDHKHFFDSVADNAIDFFDASIKDFKSKPKYSVINFCSGLELVLKARLLTEHWSLILKLPDKAELSKFKNGDFISVMVGETVDRLAKVCNENFSSDEKKCFEHLRDHRNKVVHFYHDAYSGEPDGKLLEEIAAEQCKAWCYLHRRLIGDWAKYFKKQRGAIEGINKALHGHRVFLKAKYTTLKPEIKNEISAGSEFSTCAACGYLAAQVHEVEEPVWQTECRVCSTRDSFLRMACPQCKEMTDIDDIASAFCKNKDCETDITLDDVMGKYVPSHDPKDEEEQAYYCAACEHYEKSATVLGDRYFCFWCKEWFDTTDQCDYCGEHLVGFDSAESALYGCSMCETAAREHFDKD